MDNGIKLTQDEIQDFAYSGFVQKYKRIPTKAEGVQIIRQCSSGPQKFHIWLFAGYRARILLIIFFLVFCFWGAKW
jgi:uncharacterized membrane protein